MKPKEFDELVRQKFDQNDFEYNPRNWDQLADELDGRAKKRSFMVWWWVPLAGIAASVALAIGVTPLLRHEGAGNASPKMALVQKHSVPQPAQQEPLLAQMTSLPQDHQPSTKTIAKKHNHTVSITEDNNTAAQAVLPPADLSVANRPIGTFKNVSLLNAVPMQPKDKTKEREKKIAMLEGMNTFKHTEQPQQVPKLSVILLGGINRGTQSNGYMAGATIRRMINDKVFVESDVAFASSSNLQSEYKSVSIASAAAAGARHSAGKISEESSKVTAANTAAPTVVVQEPDAAYNLSYAQVTPSIGYKLLKRMSIAAGPDFQQVLSDNRPALSADYRGNQQEAALFDVGLIGKSEYTITRNVKAAVSYRKGINTIISPSDKYFDRDYLQFQLRCAIFNK